MIDSLNNNIAILITFDKMPQQGFGCMGFSAFYASSKNTTEEQAISVFHKAVEKGVTLFNSSTFYGSLR